MRVSDVVMVQSEDWGLHRWLRIRGGPERPWAGEPSSSGGVRGRTVGERVGPGPLVAPASLDAHRQPDAVRAGLRGRAPRAHPGHRPGRKGKLADQNPKVAGPSMEDAGAPRSRGDGGGYSRLNK